ncbi:MAG TPA: hypothetical protein VFI14_00640, partial [Chryseosolibacter sp.]|nr:hypothetical protein [Chryseosolibacter sp.]
MIDEEGKFVIRIPLRNTSAVLWLCEGKKRRKGYIIVRPGDSLTMTINDTTVSFRGKNAQASEDYYHLRTENEWSQYVNALDTGYRLE